MKPPAVIVDIDNTIIDTAVRKAQLLETMGLASNPKLEDVRGDFHLRQYLGERSSEKYQLFFKQLESPETIRTLAAPLLPGARETIVWLTKRGYVVQFLSDRSESLRSATVDEFRAHGLPVEAATLHLPKRPPGQPAFDASSGLDFKVRAVHEISQEFDVLAVIGDRPEEIHAGGRAGIGTILIATTLLPEDAELHNIDSAASVTVCSSWPEIAVELAKMKSGNRELQHQRQLFADQYAGWLGEIDSKSQTTILIAGALSALTTPVLTSSNFSFGTDWPLIAALLLSIISMVYAIRSFTSRYTSGPLTAGMIPVKLKQWVAIFFDRPQAWKSVPKDALREYEELRTADEVTKARAHLRFFQERYRTRDPDALLNLRLYEMRAANYSKLYPERLASKLLVAAILLAGLWILVRTIPFQSAWDLLLKIWRSAASALG